jgi:hypothetical protein
MMVDRTAALIFGSLVLLAPAQNPAPRVIVPTAGPRMTPQPSALATATHPWRKHVTCTVFWIGEAPAGRNRTPNDKSSWDRNWVANFGGHDDPDPAARVADRSSGDFRPRAFIPQLNPFYVALPYNDVVDHRAHKPEAVRVIPWFLKSRPEPGKTVLKGKWLQIYHKGRSCFAQWEDCGPWNTDDWGYVFEGKPPKTKENGGAGIDISPSVRDYLGIKSGDKVHWRFVDAAQVPHGPWKRYGQSSSPDPGLAALQKEMLRLRMRRDEEFMKQPPANQAIR